MNLNEAEFEPKPDETVCSFSKLSFSIQENIISFLDANTRAKLLCTSKSVAKAVYSTCFHELPFSIRKGYNPKVSPHNSSYNSRLGNASVAPRDCKTSDGKHESEQLSLPVLKRAMRWWTAIELTSNPRMFETGSMAPAINTEDGYSTITNTSSSCFRVLTRCSCCFDATEISSRHKEIPHLIVCSDCVTAMLFKRDSIISIWKLTSEQVQNANLSLLDNPIQTSSTATPSPSFNAVANHPSRPPSPFAATRTVSYLPRNVSCSSPYLTHEQRTLFEKRSQALSSLPRGNVSAVFAFWDVFPLRITQPLLQPRGAHGKPVIRGPPPTEPSTPNFVTAAKVRRPRSTATYVSNGKRRKLFGAARSSVLAAEARAAAASKVASKVRAVSAGELTVDGFDVSRDLKSLEEVIREMESHEEQHNEKPRPVDQGNNHKFGQRSRPNQKSRPHGFQSAEASALHIPSSTPLDSDLHFLTRVDPKKLGIDVAGKIDSYINDPNRVVYAGVGGAPAESGYLGQLPTANPSLGGDNDGLNSSQGEDIPSFSLTSNEEYTIDKKNNVPEINSSNLLIAASTIKPSKTLQRTIDTFSCLPLMIYRRYVQCSCASLETCAEAHPHWQEDESIWPTNTSNEKVEISYLREYGLEYLVVNGFPKSKYVPFARGTNARPSISIPVCSEAPITISAASTPRRLLGILSSGATSQAPTFASSNSSGLSSYSPISTLPLNPSSGSKTPLSASSASSTILTSVPEQIEASPFVHTPTAHTGSREKIRSNRIQLERIIIPAFSLDSESTESITKPQSQPLVASSSFGSSISQFTIPITPVRQNGVSSFFGSSSLSSIRENTETFDYLDNDLISALPTPPIFSTGVSKIKGARPFEANLPSTPPLQPVRIGSQRPIGNVNRSFSTSSRLGKTPGLRTGPTMKL